MITALGGAEVKIAVVSAAALQSRRVCQYLLQDGSNGRGIAAADIDVDVAKIFGTTLPSMRTASIVAATCQRGAYALNRSW